MFCKIIAIYQRLIELQLFTLMVIAVIVMGYSNIGQINMKFYHWFIPTKKNRFHPFALRPTGLIVFLALFIAIPLVYNLTTVNKFQVLGYATNINVPDLFNFSNQERINNGLAPLTLNTQLTNAAQAKANDMITKNYWAHVSPDGITPWTFILNSGYNFTAAGENLAEGFDTSSGAVAGWMNSPDHRANILSSYYKDVGYAVVNGTLLGEQITLVVAEYGAKAEQVVATTAPVHTSAPTPAPTPITTPTPTAVSTNLAEPTVTPQTQTSTTTQTNQIVAQAAPSSKTTSPVQEGLDGIVKGIATSVPLRAYSSFNWGQKASLLLASTLMLLFIMKHTMIWREQKRGLKHIWLRAHPLGQVAVLMTVMIFTILSGVGVVL